MKKKLSKFVKYLLIAIFLTVIMFSGNIKSAFAETEDIVTEETDYSTSSENKDLVNGSESSDFENEKGSLVQRIIPTNQEGTINSFRYNKPEGYEWTATDNEAYIDLKTDSDNTENAYYEIPFYGNGIEIFAVKSHNHGKVKFTINGEGEKIVDLYNATRIEPQSVYKFTDLEEGFYTLKAELLDEKNPSSKTFVNQVSYAEISHLPYEITDVILQKDSIKLKEGATHKIDFEIEPEFASKDDVRFQSADKNIATVDQNGVIIAVKEGKTEIIISDKSSNVKEVLNLEVEKSTPEMGGSIVDINTQYTQDRFDEVKKMKSSSKTLSSWKNDKAISQISLYSNESSLKNVRLKSTNFVDGDKIIDSNNVKLTFIKSTKAYNGVGNSGYVGYGSKDRPVPKDNGKNRSESNDILYQTKPIDVGFNKLQNVWVEINVPEDTIPGIYKGTITATADGIEKDLEFNYTLYIRDAKLPDATEFEKRFDIELWQYPYTSAEYYGVDPFSPEHFKILEPIMLKYKEIGGHAITTSIIEDAWNGQTYSKNPVHYPSMIKWIKKSDGSFEYDYTDFDAWVQFNKNLGIGDKIVLYSVAPWHNSFTYWEGDVLKTEKYEVGSDRYKTVWLDFLQDLVNHLTDKGWFDDSYIGIDERGFNKVAFDIVDSVKNIHDKSLKTAGAMDGFINKPDLARRVTDLNVGDTAAAAHPTEFAKLLKDRQDLGLRTTLYSCTEHQPGNFSLSAPVESYYSIIYAGKMNTDGFLRWAYDAWVEDPLNDATHNAFEPGDPFLIYPDEKESGDRKVRSSVRLEQMAAGVRDVNKLLIMAEEVPSLKTEIKELYDLFTIAPVTNRYYLDDVKVEELSSQAEEFREGIDSLTQKYISLKENSTDIVESIEFEKDSDEIMLGNSKKLKAIIKPDNIIDNSVIWKSSNNEIVSVDKNGLITANSIGKAIITATSVLDKTKKANIEIIVSAVKVGKDAQVAYYSFDNDKGGTVNDQWGSRDGKNLGSFENGKSGKALKVTKAGEGVELDGDSGIGPDDSWSIVYWVNTDADFNKEISVISDRNKDFAGSLKMASDRDSGFRVGKKPGDVLTYAYNFKANTWYHVAWTQSKKDGLSMYVNGSLVSNNAWTKNHPTKFPMDLIGSTGFTGLIDEVKVFNKVLNPAEITSTMLIKGLNIRENQKSLYINDTYQIETNLISDNDDKTITFISNNPEVAEVDSKGNVKVKSEGQSIISVENKAGGYKEEVKIEVKKKLTISNTLDTYKLPENRLTDIEKAPGTERQYLGQPDMVRTKSGRLITAFPMGHGKGPIIMKYSDDNGETWTEKTDLPKSWKGSQETPTLYVLNLENGVERIMLITACPGWGTDSAGNKTGWNTSYSDDNGETWTEYSHWHSNHKDGRANKSIVAMASLVQLKDENGKYIQKWMGVYHDYDYINYKTYLTFEDGKEHWSDPEPYLSQYRDIERTYKMCEIGMFRSPDGNSIVGLARSQSHNNPATLIYSNDEGKTWSKPMDLPGSLAGERHKAAYDPISGRLLITFREIIYDLNKNNQFDGNKDWLAGEWVAWVGTFDDLMNQNDGQYRIEIAKDYTQNAKSGDTGYTGLVVLEDGTFIIHSYGHFDEEFSNNWKGGVTTDLSYIKQAKFKLSEIDNMAGLIDRTDLQKLLDQAKEIAKEDYTQDSWDNLQKVIEKAKMIYDSVESNQKEIDEAKSILEEAISKLTKTPAEPVIDESITFDITNLSKGSDTFSILYHEEISKVNVKVNGVEVAATIEEVYNSGHTIRLSKTLKSRDRIEISIITGNRQSGTYRRRV